MPDYDALLDRLEPREVFSKFLELTKIPRGSGNEKAVSDHLKQWAESKGFPVKQDDQYNLLIKKPGVRCAANAAPVILQGHLDMVCNARPGVEFDFKTQPIEPVIDGDILHANGTTLGADDGIGVAFILALLDSANLVHPPLEAVFTTGEETGMYGAAAFDVSQLNGASFINIDSEEEGIFYASCAGGARIDLTFPIATEAAAGLGKGLQAAVITVSGLRGGHSGVEIDKERGNSHRLSARILRAFADKYPDFRIASVSGGLADNAIPSSTKSVVMFKQSDREAIEQELAQWQETLRNELKASDGKPGPDGKAYNVTVTLEDAAAPDAVLDKDSREKLLFALLVIPTGVAAMDLNNPEQLLPESSSNLAIVEVGKDKATIRTSVRSQIASKKELLKAQIGAIGKVLGATMGIDGDYPGWEFDPNSRIRPLFVKLYEMQTENKAVVQGVHAGLECGLFSDKALELGKKIDFASIGPDLRDVHTPDESLSISSTGRTWDLLKAVLANVAEKGLCK